MPRLWTETIATHRREVRDAIVENAAALVRQHGLRAVTMSQIAEETGIGRATLYKYFPDVEAILGAWHERHITSHLSLLEQIGRGPGRPGERLAAVLDAYARIQHQHHGSDLEALLHREEHVAPAREHLLRLLEGLIGEAAQSAEVRADVSPHELATYCLHALAGSSGAPSEAAVRRLVNVTLDGLRGTSRPQRARKTS